MTAPSFFGSQALTTLALVGFAGCGGAAVAKQTLRPVVPEDPCSIKREPDLYIRGTSFDILTPLHGNLKFLRDINPVFLCGLERIEVLGDEQYKASADPVYTRRSVGLYTSADRVIHLKASAGITLTHEVGHHVYNLGPFAPTVRDFLAQSWTRDASGERIRRCAGPDCFINDAAQSEPTEDWARTFEMVLMRPVETGVATNFSLQSPTPIQEKIRLIRSLGTLPEPLPGSVRFGKAAELDDATALKLEEDSRSQEMPSSLPSDTVRRIFREGKRSLQRSVWDNRRRPFLAGDYVVFPVFRSDRKTLGFFAYDLRADAFRPVELALQDIPEEFQNAATTFSELQIVPDANGDLQLIGLRPGFTALAAPVSFQF